MIETVIAAPAGTWVSIPGLLFMSFSLLALLAGSGAVIRSQLIKSQVEQLEGYSKLLERQLQESRHEIDNCNLKFDALNVKYDAEISKREALEEVVTGRKELEAVVTLLRRHDDRTKRVEDLVRQIADRK